MNDVVAAVKKAAELVARDWVTTLEVEDLQQDVWTELFEDPNLWEEIQDSDNPIAIARHLAKRCASKTVSAYEFHSGQYQYGTKEVRSILGSGVLKTQDFKTLTERADVTVGMENLRSRHSAYADALVDRYFWGKKDGADMTLSRAVDALTEEMNRANTASRFSHKEGPGKRTVISNATAIEVTRSVRNQDPTTVS